MNWFITANIMFNNFYFIIKFDSFVIIKFRKIILQKKPFKVNWRYFEEKTTKVNQTEDIYKKR